MRYNSENVAITLGVIPLVITRNFPKQLLFLAQEEMLVFWKIAKFLFSHCSLTITGQDHFFTYKVIFLVLTLQKKCYGNIPVLQTVFNFYCFISEIKLHNDINKLLRLSSVETKLWFHARNCSLFPAKWKIRPYSNPHTI